MSHSIRRAAIAAALLVASLLPACGGGGSNSDDSQVQVQSGALPLDTAKASSVSSEAQPSITLSRPAAEVSFLKSADRIKVTSVQTLHVEFKKSQLLVGYAPGAPEVDWLYLPSSKQTLSEKAFDLRLEFFPTTHAPGIYTTTLRFINRTIEGNEPSYVDLPIRMQVYGTPALYAGDVKLTSNAGGAAPAPLVLPLDLAEVPSPSIQASVVNGNSAAASWLGVAVSGDGKSITLTPKSVAAAGEYTGFVNVHYKALGGESDKRIPITLTVAPSVVSVSHVTPWRVAPGRPVQLIVTGAGFSLGDIKKVQVGSMSATRIERYSDTQLAAQFDQLTGSGNQTVSVTVGAKTVQASGAVLVADDVSLPAATLAFGEDVAQTVFDDRTLSLFVRTAQRLYRMQWIDGAWQIVATRVQPLPYFELSGDGRGLVMVDNNNITVLDAATLNEVLVRPLPNATTGATGYESVWLISVMNNGDLVLSLPHGNFSETYSNKLAVYHFSSGILEISPNIGVMLLTATTSNRDKLKMVSNWSNPPSFYGDYLPASNTFVGSDLPGTGIGGNQFAMSGDGNRVMLGQYIYDIAAASKVYITGEQLYNYQAVLSPDGSHFYAVFDDGHGVADYQVSSTAMSLSRNIPGPLDSPRMQWASITPNGQALIAVGKVDTGFNQGQRNVYIIPLR